MSKILVAAEIRTTSRSSRDGFISHLIAASEYSAEKEPGVLKYSIHVPADPADEQTVWAIEEYADKKALDDHMATPPVKEMIAYMTNNSIVEGAPKIRNLSWLNNMVFTKPEVLEQKDPFPVFVELDFESGKREETLKYWKGNLESSKEESGCFIYGFAHDPEHPNTMFTFEVYESEEYLWNTHVKAAAVQETIERTKDVRKSLTMSKLKFHAGFLSR